MTHHDAHAGSPAPVLPSAPATPPGSESAEELLSGVHARLLPAESLPPEAVGSMRYARMIADGLVFAYALDTPDLVRSLTDSDVERAGARALGKAAYENLMRVPVQHDEVPVEGGAVLHTVYGDSFFVASKALYLNEVARQVTGAPLPRAGALVAVPTRHNLVFHPIADGSVVDALNSLATYALGAYQDGSGPLSPRVYWWHRGGLTSLTVIDHDTRTFSLQPPPHLLAMMKGLTQLDRAGRLNTRGAAQAPGLPELTTATADLPARAAENPSALSDAFASAVALAHARCAEDPRADLLSTWDAWATAVQLGSALFTGAGPQECRLGENFVRRLPATPAAPPADARAWLDAFYLAAVCRQTDRLTRLCQVPMDRLREGRRGGRIRPALDRHPARLHPARPDERRGGQAHRHPADLPAPGADARTGRLRRPRRPPAGGPLPPHPHPRPAGLHPGPDRGPGPPHRLLGLLPGPRARIALGPLALACLAHDHGFPVPEDHRLLPANLLNGRRIEAIP